MGEWPCLAVLSFQVYLKPQLHWVCLVIVTLSAPHRDVDNCSVIFNYQSAHGQPNFTPDELECTTQLQFVEN